MYTQRCAQNKRKTQTEIQLERYGQTRAETFQIGCALGTIYDVDNRKTVNSNKDFLQKRREHPIST